MLGCVLIAVAAGAFLLAVFWKGAPFLNDKPSLLRFIGGCAALTLVVATTYIIGEQRGYERLDREYTEALTHVEDELVLLRCVLERYAG